MFNPLPAALSLDLPRPGAKLLLELLNLEQAAALPPALRAAATGVETNILILQRLSAGSGYRVSWGGEVFDVRLRGGYLPGEAVRITIPQSRASLPHGASREAAGANSAGAGIAVAPARTHPHPEIRPESASLQVDLGAPARQIDALIARATSMPRGVPLALPASGSSAPLPAESLARGLIESGAFYESHLLQWMRGDRPLDALKREPQGRITSRGQARQGSTVQAAGSDAQARLPGVPDSLLLILGEQLRSLDRGELTWRGEAWPNQPFELCVSRDQPWSHARDPSWKVPGELPENEAGPGPASEPSWQAVLNLELPSLGKVRAALRLQGDRVRVMLGADDDAMQRMRERAAALAASLAEQGVQLAALQWEIPREVTREEPRDERREKLRGEAPRAT